MTNLRFSPEQEKEQIVNLLTRVNQNSPYFKNRFSDFIENHSNKPVRDFFKYYAELPYFTKSDYVEAGEKIINENKLQILKNKKLEFNSLIDLGSRVKEDFLFSMATGGSSSLPLKVYMDKYHSMRMLFSFFNCWHQMGWKPGDKVLVFYPNNIYDLHNFSQYNNLSFLTGIEFFLFEELNISTVKKLIKKLNSFKPKMLMIFPSPLNIISFMILKEKLHLNYQPPLINVSGETFFDCQKNNIKKVFFKSKIEESYGSVELGEIAHQENNKLKVFSNFAYAENAVINSERPEILVTLHDHDFFPFIRYQMGDLMNIDNGYLSNINGKSSNKITLPSGKILYPLDLNEVVNKANNFLLNKIVDIKLEKFNDDIKIKLIIENAQMQSQYLVRTFLSIFENKFDFQPQSIEIVEQFNHDYRLKYRVIEDKSQELEYAGGVIK